MTGWVANGCPAVAVADGWVWMTSWLAAAGLTTIELVGDEVKPPPVNLSEMRLGLVVGQVRERRHAARRRWRSSSPGAGRRRWRARP